MSVILIYIFSDYRRYFEEQLRCTWSFLLLTLDKTPTHRNNLKLISFSTVDDFFTFNLQQEDGFRRLWHPVTRLVFHLFRVFYSKRGAMNCGSDKASTERLAGHLFSPVGPIQNEPPRIVIGYTLV